MPAPLFQKFRHVKSFTYRPASGKGRLKPKAEQHRRGRQPGLPSSPAATAPPVLAPWAGVTDQRLPNLLTTRLYFVCETSRCSTEQRVSVWVRTARPSLKQELLLEEEAPLSALHGELFSWSQYEVQSAHGTAPPAEFHGEDTQVFRGLSPAPRTPGILPSLRPRPCRARVHSGCRFTLRALVPSTRLRENSHTGGNSLCTRRHSRLRPSHINESSE
ncbi:hypothetical protein P7K49_000040 [Saguinus oedipus]|uniref:Uncharacterized protein n=1 Tax=Saguinus oedipus TaxID=9490 RepID=A0ABQ9WAI9_SAGOE|nr:hypothetical protein P7K49_000040 [Saguinus oedipus]